MVGTAEEAFGVTVSPWKRGKHSDIWDTQSISYNQESLYPPNGTPCFTCVRGISSLLSESLSELTAGFKGVTAGTGADVSTVPLLTGVDDNFDNDTEIRMSVVSNYIKWS